jgi:signal transduction histidine kinase
MSLVARLTLSTGLCAALLLGGGGALLLQREAEDLRHVAVGEATLLARSLQTAFENALRDRQIEDVTETLGALERVDPSVAIFVFDEQGKLVGASTQAVAGAATKSVEERARERTDAVVELVPADSPTTLRLGLRLREETPSQASAIVLEKPLDELQRDLEDTRRAIALAIVLVVMAIAGLTWLLSKRYLSHPLQRMVQGMRRVRAGDLRTSDRHSGAREVVAVEREFQALVRDLEQARVRAREETEARQRVEQGLAHADKLITLGQLSAVMAHEIGSPLQVLEGRARALRKHADDPELTRRAAEHIVEQSERITRIVGQMLSITRRRSPKRGEIDAALSVQRVVALLELEARRRSVSIEFAAQGETRLVADGDQLQQVALNLLQNALDAAPPGSRITVELTGDEEGLVLDVRDRGGGVPEAIRGRLFEPFFTTKAERGGSGLGLSVVRSLVRDHGGAIDFQTPRDGGCLVRVCIPRATKESQ